MKYYDKYFLIIYHVLKSAFLMDKVVNVQIYVHEMLGELQITQQNYASHKRQKRKKEKEKKRMYCIYRSFLY